MILRCTSKMLALLGVKRAALVTAEPDDDDWYLNLLWIERRKCLLLTHAGTLYPAFVAYIRKAELLPIGPYVVDVVEEHLRSEGLGPATLGRLDRHDVHVAKTASRSVLGIMNEMAFEVRYQVAADGGLARCDVDALNQRLRRTLHNRGGHYVRPIKLARADTSDIRSGHARRTEHMPATVGTRPLLQSLVVGIVSPRRRIRPIGSMRSPYRLHEDGPRSTTFGP